MRYFISEKEGFKTIDVSEENGLFHVDYNGKHYQLDIERIDQQLYSVIRDDKVFKFIGDQKDTVVRILTNHVDREVTILNQRQKMEAELFGSGGAEEDLGDVKAPMPGMVLRVEVKTGDVVEVGQPLLVIEAMKMENEIRATKAGTVAEVLCSPQQAVERDDLLIRLND